MRSFVWLTRFDVEAIHDSQIQDLGGLSGVRDENALESVVYRAQQKQAYDENADVATLATAYAWIARSHAFVDGNKRTALVSMMTFLDLNGFVFDAPKDDVLQAFLLLAEGQFPELRFADWVRRHI